MPQYKFVAVTYGKNKFPKLAKAGWSGGDELVDMNHILEGMYKDSPLYKALQERWTIQQFSIKEQGTHSIFIFLLTNSSPQS